MGSVQLLDLIRDVSVEAVDARMKPMSIQIGTYIGESRAHLGSGLDVDVVIPRSILPCCNPTAENVICAKACCVYQGSQCPCPKRIRTGDSILILKEDGQHKYYVLAKI